MKWMIVAVIAFVYPNGAQDYYIWPEPTFDSMEECLFFGSQAKPYLIAKLNSEYPNKEIEMISCVDLDVVNDILAKNILDDSKDNGI